MSPNQLIQQKMVRLQQLRQFQTQHGYPVIAEINQLEAELGQLLRTGVTADPPPQHSTRQTKPPFWNIAKLSQATIDMIAIFAFMGLMLLLCSILLSAFIYNNKQRDIITQSIQQQERVAILRPTYTPTADPNAPPPENPPMDAGAPADTFLPTPAKATDIATPVPSPTSRETATSTPLPATPTPLPTATRLPPTPIPVRVKQPATPTPAPPPPTAAPSYPFILSEQGNREFQRTTFHAVTVYVAVVSPGNIPLGGYKIVGDHSSGLHAESGLSTWNWSVVNCLDCDYVKQGNLKFEPGTFMDGTWNIYLADAGGTQLSSPVALPYSGEPDQWVWDFVIFRQR